MDLRTIDLIHRSGNLTPLDGQNVEVVTVSKWDGKRWKFYIQARMLLKNLLSLNEEINDYCTSKLAEKLDRPPSYKEWVFVYSNERAKWCRGIVMDETDRDSVPVFLVDWGEELEVPIKHVIKKYQPIISKMPPLAFKCYLTQLYNENTCNIFEDLSKANIFRLDVKEELIVNLLLFDPSTGTFQCISDLIFQQLKAQAQQHRSASAVEVPAQYRRVNVNSSFPPLGYHREERPNTAERNVVRSISRRSSPANSLKSSKGSQKFSEPLKYKYEDLRKDEVILVRVKSIKSPFDFYIQRHHEEYDRLMEYIQRYVASGADDLATVNVKDPCIAYITSNKYYWNRAIVIRNNPDQSHLVKFVDLGYEVEIPFGRLKKSCSEILRMPILAYHCTLNDVVITEENYDTANRWFHKVVFDTEKILSAKICGYDEENQTYHIILKDKAQGTIINKEINKRFSAVNREYQVQSHRLSGTTFKAFVTKYTSPNDIYVTSYSNYENLLIMQEEIQQYCKSQQKKNIDNLEENLPCLALCSTDNHWYRGIVKKIMSQQQIKVFFVDFGIENVLSIESLKIIPVYFLKSIVSLMHCSIKFENDWTWTKKQLEYCLDFFENNKIVEITTGECSEDTYEVSIKVDDVYLNDKLKMLTSKDIVVVPD